MLQIFVAVQLLIVGVGDGIELRLVLRGQHRLGVAPEVGAGHRDDMHLVAGDELAEMLAELVVGIGRDVVKLVHGDQPIVERLDAELVHGEAESRMGADQHLVVAFEECADRIDLAAVSRPARCRDSISAERSSRPKSRYLLSGSSLKLAPIAFSGTTMIACLSP